jgi:hypothetical protein
MTQFSIRLAGEVSLASLDFLRLLVSSVNLVGALTQITTVTLSPWGVDSA